MGGKGAKTVASILHSRGLRFEYVLDEGGSIVSGVLPLHRPAALIGISEKGFQSIELVVETQGGHSSMPPLETPIGILSNAITKLEKNQLPASVDGVLKMMFEFLSKDLPLHLRVLMANSKLLSPLIIACMCTSLF